MTAFVPRVVLDLCSGTGGATTAFDDNGYKVITVDNNPANRPSVVTDIREWAWSGERPVFVWASPPCQEFSRQSMPWLRARNPPPPDMSILEACLRIIRDCQPDWWVVENVRGAIPFFSKILGLPVQNIGPFFLWGRFPWIQPIEITKGFKQSVAGNGSRGPRERGRVPLSLSYEFLKVIEWST